MATWFREICLHMLGNDGVRRTALFHITILIKQLQQSRGISASWLHSWLFCPGHWLSVITGRHLTLVLWYSSEGTTESVRGDLHVSDTNIMPGIVHKLVPIPTKSNLALVKLAITSLVPRLYREHVLRPFRKCDRCTFWMVCVRAHGKAWERGYAITALIAVRDYCAVVHPSEVLTSQYQMSQGQFSIFDPAVWVLYASKVSP